MLAYFLFLFAAFTATGTLVVIGANRIPGAMKVIVAVYNTLLIFVLVLAALQLTG